MRNISLLILIQVCSMSFIFAQGFDPAEMAAREKQNLYKLITDLSEDQIMLIDGIYDEYTQTFIELRKEIRQSRDFRNFRPKIMALRQEKDELMADVLNEDQFQLYTDQMESNRQNRQNRQNRRPPENQAPTEIQ